MAPVDDAQRQYGLAAEQRGGIRLIGDAAGIGGDLVGGEAGDGIAAAATEAEPLQVAGAFGDGALVAAIDEEEPQVLRRGGEEPVGFVRLDGDHG